MAWFYLFIHKHYYYGGDVYTFLESGKKLFDFAFENLPVYLELNFGINAAKPTEFIKVYSDQIGFYRDTSSFFMIRVNAVLNWITFKIDWVNALIYQIVSFVGLVAIYKSFNHFYPKEKTKLLLGIFLVPSVLFWHSGLHKEAISIFTIGICLWTLVKNCFIKKDYWLIFVSVLAFLMLITVRNYLAFLMIPAILGFILAKKAKLKSIDSYSIVYFVLFIVANIAVFVSPKVSYLNRIYEVHYYFKVYAKGNSDIEIPDLEPTAYSFLKNIPRAIYNSLCRPNFFDIENTHLLFRTIAALESFAVLLLIAFAIIFNKFSKLKYDQLLIFNLLYSISFLILIGMTINNLGAMARYKSVIYPLLVTSLLLITDFSKINFFKKKEH